MNIKDLLRANKHLGRWLKWECGSLTLFHAYAQRFGCPAGGNVYLFVLQDALAHRGMTLERLRAAAKERKWL